MAHPKRKISKQEEIKRTHYKATVAQNATCLTGEIYTTELLDEEKCTTEGKLLYKSVAVVMHFLMIFELSHRESFFFVIIFIK
jgi:hypothetical protein